MRRLEAQQLHPLGQARLPVRPLAMEPLEPRLLLSAQFAAAEPFDFWLGETNGATHAVRLNAESLDSIVVATDANTPVAGDTNGWSDVFLVDLDENETTRASISTDGTQADGPSNLPAVSATGRYVVFCAEATTLAVQVGPEFQVYLRDTLSGTTTLISRASDGTPADGRALYPAISANGGLVAFVSYSTNLPGGDGETGQLYLHEVSSGTTTLISKAPDDAPGDADSVWYSAPSFSSDGQWLVFQSNASNLIDDDSNGTGDIFAANLDTGEIQRVSVASDGTQANGESRLPAISADGSAVVFVSDATNLVDGDSNGVSDVFVHELDSGLTVRVSVATGGAQANDGVFDTDFQRLHPPTIDPTGRYVAFSSLADNLVLADTNDAADVFLHDRVMVQTQRVSLDWNQTQPNADSYGPSLAWDGGDSMAVAFLTDADNLFGGDDNGVADPVLAWMDVIADAQGAAIVDVDAPDVLAESPGVIEVTFDRDMDVASIGTDDVELTTPTGQVVAIEDVGSSTRWWCGSSSRRSPRAGTTSSESGRTASRPMAN